MIHVLLATRNEHKRQEIAALLGPQFIFQTLNELPAAPQVIEDADSFAGNATKKALGLVRWLPNQSLDQPINYILADDSGLEVDALGGAPGVHSARFAAIDRHDGGNSPDLDNNAKLLRLLANVPAEQRTARFRCVLALGRVAPQSASQGRPEIQLFDGTCEGRIDFAPRGQNGFGYDPLFLPTGFDRSFAELGEAVKNKISHRARALEQLRAICARGNSGGRIW